MIRSKNYIPIRIMVNLKIDFSIKKNILRYHYILYS